MSNDKIVQLKSYDEKNGTEIGNVLPITNSEAVKVENDKNLQQKLTEITTNIEQTNASFNNVERNCATKLELEVERNRINLLSKIENGETDGNTELLDIRNGADGILYPTAAEAVRKQITDVTDTIMPLDYPNLAKIITHPDQAGKDKRVTATFDTIYLEQISVTTGKGGLSFDIDYTKYKTLSCNIEYKGMGCNCGVYYYSDKKLLSPYQAISSPCSDDIKNADIKIHFDKTTIENKMSVIGANKLKFIVWNNDNPIVGGYNYITNFSLDDYVPPIKHVSKVKEMLKHVPLENIVMPNAIIGKTSDLIVWGSNVEYTYINDDEIHYKYSKSSGNNGLMTKGFKAQSNCILCSLTITELISGGLMLYVTGLNKHDNSTLYIGITPITQLGKFSQLINLTELSNTRNLDLSKNINILVANYNITDVKFKEFTVYYNEYLEYDLIKDNLSSTLKAFNSEIRNINTALDNADNKLSDIDAKINDINTGLEKVSYDNVIMQNTINCTNSDIITWGSQVDYTNINGVIHYKYTSTTGNNGLMTRGFIPKNTFVSFALNITEIVCGGLILYVKGFKKSDGSTVYLSIKQLQTLGEHTEIIDLNNLVVYKDLDINRTINILVANKGVTDITFTDFHVYANGYLEYSLIQNNLGDTLKTLDNEINVLKSAIGTSNNNYLVSPNGTKFMLNVLDDGSITSIPFIPNKTLFIGNSLLLGHKSFGMCATTSKKDYYYYVTQHIKSLNSNATFEKMSGTGFEDATNIETVNSWLEHNINNKANDYNLVYIQLGDNVNTTDKVNNFKTSCEYLVRHLRNKFKNARIIWVGMWYSSSEKVEIITNACNNTGCQFINIVDLSIQENKGKIGDTIYYDDGSTSVVSSNGVASHPGDTGQLKIANRIIEMSF